jgi:uncharacterized protein
MEKMIMNSLMKFLLKISVLFFGLALSLNLLAQAIPKPMSPPRLLNDFHGLISAGASEEIERQLLAYNDTTSTQIAVVIETTLFDGDDFARAFAIYDTWGIGSKGKDNGVLLYIAFNERKIRIITGYGAEGFLPDALAKRIIEQIIKPYFKEENYDTGVLKGIQAIMAAGSGEYVAEIADDETPDWLLFLVIGFMIFVLIMSVFGPKGNGGGYSGHGRYDDWSGFGGRNRGGWMFPGSSGGGGGGFGGFGGGMSGGGGAGGSW